MSIAKTYRFVISQKIRGYRSVPKRTSSGRELAFYCGPGLSGFRWGPDRTASTRVSGSEQAVIHLTRALARLGWQITVFNNCGDRPLSDAGVTYRPHWEFDPRERQDVVVLWRMFKLLDLDINAGKVLVDLHDAGDPGVSSQRLRRLHRVFVKSSFQRSYVSTVPDDQVAVVPNGLDLASLHCDLDEKDPFLLVNTSAPERSLDVLPELFRRIKRRVPQARLQWAFGWDSFMGFQHEKSPGIEWSKRVVADMADAGIEALGRLSEPEVAALYRRASLFVYPTAFAEIDCISVKKAQACGCVPVTTNAAALAETARHGIQIPLQNDNPLDDTPGFHTWGIKDPATQAAWVDAVVELLQSPQRRADLAQRGAQWAHQWDWSAIAKRWDAVMGEPCRGPSASR